MTNQPQYTIAFKKSALKELETLSSSLRDRIIESVENLSFNPCPHGSLKLKSNLPLWRIRVGNYRILYEIKDSVLTVYVIKVAHRKDVYRSL